MDWDSNGDLSFGEFVYAFSKWVDIEGADEDTRVVDPQVPQVIDRAKHY